jgi:hypothetical protein
MPDRSFTRAGARRGWGYVGTQTREPVDFVGGGSGESRPRPHHPLCLSLPSSLMRPHSSPPRVGTLGCGVLILVTTRCGQCVEASLSHGVLIRLRRRSAGGCGLREVRLQGSQRGERRRKKSRNGPSTYDPVRGDCRDVLRYKYGWERRREGRTAIAALRGQEVRGADAVSCLNLQLLARERQTGEVSS